MFEYNDSDVDVIRRRISADGTLAEGEMAVSNTSANEGYPAVASNSAFRYQVVWQDERDSSTQGLNIYGDGVELYRLSGRVFDGLVGDETQPLAGVTVDLACSGNIGDPGTVIASTQTDSSGWYGLIANADCEFLNLLETDLPGYVSDGATSVSGAVVNANWIQHSSPLAGKNLTGNKFWDAHQETATSTTTSTRTPTPTATNSPTPTATSTQTATPVSTPVWIHFEELSSGTWVKEQYVNKGVHFMSDYLYGQPYRAAPQIQAHANARSSPYVLVNQFSDGEFSNSVNVPLALCFEHSVTGVGMWLGTTSNCSGSVSASVKLYDINGNLRGSASASVSSNFNTPVEVDDPLEITRLLIVDYGASACPEAIDELAFLVRWGLEPFEQVKPIVNISSHTDNQLVN